MSVMAFCRHGRPLRRLGNCSACRRRSWPGPACRRGSRAPRRTILAGTTSRRTARYAGRRTVGVGFGQSAVTTLLALAKRAEQVPETSIVWALRRPGVKHSYYDEPAAAFRGASGAKLREHIGDKRIEQVADFSRRTVKPTPTAGWTSSTKEVARSPRTGSCRPPAFTPITRSPRRSGRTSTPSREHRAMGPWVDPNSHRYDTIPPHILHHLVYPNRTSTPSG